MWNGLNSSNMPMYQPAVPKQHNMNDCGYYLLEFIETFLADPKFILKNLNQKNVKLFKTRLVENKRQLIKIILDQLKCQQSSYNDSIVADRYHTWRKYLFKRATH